MKKTLLASAIILAFGFAGQAMAGEDHGRNHNNNSDPGTATVGRDGTAADNGAWAQTNTNTAVDSFNPTKVMAMSVLNGSVSGVGVSGIGNSAQNEGMAIAKTSSNGGKGGSSSARTDSDADAGAGHARYAHASAHAHSGNAGSGAGGDGGNGGGGTAGASNVADAGSFNMSNNMSSAAQSAAGIAVIAQNSGAASLVQQNVTLQANVTAGAR